MEVAIGPVGDEELVFLEVALGAPDDLTVLDGEQGGIRRQHPAGEVFAVEERLEVVVCLLRGGEQAEEGGQGHERRGRHCLSVSVVRR